MGKIYSRHPQSVDSVMQDLWRARANVDGTTYPQSPYSVEGVPHPLDDAATLAEEQFGRGEMPPDGFRRQSRAHLVALAATALRRQM